MAGWFDYEEDVAGNENNLAPKERFFSPFPLPMIKSRKAIIEEIDNCLTNNMNSEISYSEDFYTPDTKYYRRSSASHNTDPHMDVPISTIPKASKSANEITTPACSDIENNYPDSKENQHQKNSSFRKIFYSLLPANTKKHSLTQEFKRVPRKSIAPSSDRCSSFASKLKSSIKGKTKRIQEYDYPYCAAKSCLTPAGASIDWICCDTCEKWYHQICLRLKIAPEGDYECPPCSKAKNIN
nr:lysine specific demethylase lid [Hymenolepis microstoma]